ncbi:serine/threonine protein phosphatase [Amorphoplanes nipponensis]|uniref:Serine/threonine protein phosphatase n=1 Tax=Actinoplanes nipponensis TaxID=135950 RepID=A0A919MP54_9ACTN|nr:metallophosphoesterase [Actinoplanes nipponensis]GIE49158.1 serine/threonine protein phosphatase [Actinoplanes nipponensis]
MKGPLYVLSDIHGHRTEFHDVLREAGLAGRDGEWSGGGARLWLLGDYVDRGPDGIGVIEDIARLTASAADRGGTVSALLGNHEAQLLAAYRFGSEPVRGWPDGLHGAWQRFGGRATDLRRLTSWHVGWITARPAMALVDGHLLLHSDTVRYLELGAGVAEVNAATRSALAFRDSAAALAFCEVLSARDSFRGAGPARPGDPVSRMLGAFGGEMIVHGHSTLTKQFGLPPADVRAALRYADGRVLAVDGGLYEGGRLLLTRLG